MSEWRGLLAGLMLVAGLSAAAVAPAEAHGPSRQKVSSTAVLAASPDDVFAVVGNFADMSWYPGVTATEVSADGKTRKVTFEGGVTVDEELAKQDAAKRVISFRRTADDVALIPVTNFSNQIAVADEAGKAKVTWTAAFYRGYPNNDPPAGMDDAAAKAAGEAFIAKGLEALTARFGAGG